MKVRWEITLITFFCLIISSEKAFAERYAPVPERTPVFTIVPIPILGVKKDVYASGLIRRMRRRLNEAVFTPTLAATSTSTPTRTPTQTATMDNPA